MKSKNLKFCLFGVVGLVGLWAASAYAINGTSQPYNPGPVGLGPWVGEYKFIHPHTGPDGRYYTYQYVPVTGTTLASCEQQLNSAGAQLNVTITKYCTSQQ